MDYLFDLLGGENFVISVLVLSVLLVVGYEAWRRLRRKLRRRKHRRRRGKSAATSSDASGVLARSR